MTDAENNKQTVQMQVGDNDESEFVDQEAASNEAAIRSIVALTEKDPAALCEHVSEDVLEQLGGDDCAQNATESDDGHVRQGRVRRLGRHRSPVVTRGWP